MANETSTDDLVKNNTRENGAQTQTDEDTEDLRYGFGRFRPPWMQVFNRPKIVLVILSYTAFVQGFIVNGVINANMSTLEKRFELSSSMSSWIASVYDITAAPIALFVCFKGAVNYKLRWLGCGFVVFSMGSFLMALPHVFAESYEWEERTSVHCLKSTKTNYSCNDIESNHLHEYLGVFLLGQIFHSVGGGILYSLGMTILDDIVEPVKTPLYIGIMMLFSTLGPALGYIVGGQLLNVFVDPTKGNEVSFDSSDPRWIGAWWICFFLSGSLSIFIGPILLGYGRELPVTKSIRLSRESQVHKGAETHSTDSTDSMTSIDIPLILLTLFKNPVYLLLSLASASTGIALSGLSTYLPKYFENEFDETATRAAFITGAVAIPSAAGGQFLGGYLCKRFSLKVLGQCRLSIASLSIGLLFLGIFWAKCEDTAFAGITQNYNLSDLEPFTNNVNIKLESSLYAKCNSECSCMLSNYHPVCGSDGVQYFNPCFAGCATFNIENKKHFNCSCVTNLKVDTAVEGKCAANKCSNYYITIVVLVIVVLCSFTAHTPIVAMILRCISDNHRSYGLGISSAIGRLLGTFPGPILFGVAIDKACRLWKNSCSEGDTSCLIYQKETLSRNFFLLTVIIRVFTILFLVIAKCLYKPPKPATETNIDHEPRVNVFIVDDKSFDNEAFSTNL